MWSLLADLVLIAHLAFVAFVVLGALLLLPWPRLAWLHVPAVAWAVALELAGWTCPLTPLEKALRRTAGEAGYAEGFVAHHLLPVLYPPGLEREDQWLLGLGALLLNAALYTWLWRHRRIAPRR